VTPEANQHPQLLVLRSETSTLCGVEAFARRLATTAGSRAVTHALDRDLAALGRALAKADALVINLPVVAWKKKLVEPSLAAAAARARGRDVLVVLHEWADLDWKRRASYAALLPLATAILFSSPEVAAQFAASPLARLTTGRRGLTPIPPNLARPEVPRETAQSRSLAAERARGRLVLGHFGSIYPKKQSSLVLDVAAELQRRGADPFVAFIGSFVKGADRVEEEFFARARALGLEDRILVTGYVATDEEVFGLFDQVDVFVYAFEGGLTSRRGSVLAAAASGRPVVVNAPHGPQAFDHHGTYRRLLAAGQLRLVRTDAGIEDLAEAVLASRGAPGGPSLVDMERAWDEVLASADALLGKTA
jgi:glycosyltransferase involved in cell wall biosynthesis